MTDPANESLSKYLFNETGDTPFKPPSSYGMLYGETARQARDNVKNDLRNNVRIVSPDDFRKSLLPMDENFDRELKNVKRKFYNKRWKGFPDPLKEKDPAESKFYGPFVNIAQAVSEACRKRAPKDAVESNWVDCHSRAPATLSKDDPQIRPDIVQVSTSTSPDFHKVNESLGEAEGDEKRVRKLEIFDVPDLMAWNRNCQAFGGRRSTLSSRSSPNDHRKLENCTKR